MTFCKKNIDIGNDLPIKFEMKKLEDHKNYYEHIEFSQEEYSIISEILKSKTIMQIAKNMKLKKEVIRLKITMLFKKLGLDLNLEFIDTNSGQKQIKELLLFFYSLGIFNLRYDYSDIKEIIDKINDEETSRRSLSINNSLNNMEINVIKGLIEGRKITEIDSAIKLNNRKLSYQKVLQKILQKMNSNNLVQAVYKAVKLSII